MKKTKLIIATLVACLLFFGGVSNVSAQEPEEEEIEFGILGAILLQNMVMGNIT